MNKYYLFNLSDKIQNTGKNLYKKQILKLGKWIYNGGVLNITKQFMRKILDNFRNRIIENVYVPYGHTSDPTKNTGNVVDLALDDEGMNVVIEVDSEAGKLIEQGKIKGISAGIDPDYQDKKTGKRVGPVLRHVALVLEPYLIGLEPYVALEDNQQIIDLNEEIMFMKLEDIKAKVLEIRESGQDVDKKLAQLRQQKKVQATITNLALTEEEVDAIFAFEEPNLEKQEQEQEEKKEEKKEEEKENEKEEEKEDEKDTKKDQEGSKEETELSEEQ